jgi:N-acetylglucosaminyl-diphospho-decaprenol L-rhamnosyltransferase
VSEARPVDLSVIIVNYNVASLVLQAVASLERQKFAGPNGRDGHLEILVIDNASSPADVELLQQLPASVILLRNDRNMGFAAANNRGLEAARGRYLCFLNPDTLVLDGTLDTLLQYLYRHPEVGAVGPKIWVDEAQTLLVPPGDPPTLTFICAKMLGGAVQPLGWRLSENWHRRALAFWRSRRPLSVPMLSGACILTSRAVVERVGGFEEGYFLYYEDADWCRRVRQAGYQLRVVPDAAIIHYYNQSGRQDPLGAYGHALRSQARFVDQHYGLFGRVIYTAAQRISNRLARWQEGGSVMSPTVADLGRLEAPPRLRAGDAVHPAELVFQIGYDRLFVPAVAAFVRETEFQLSAPVWARLQAGRYWARVIDPERVRPLAIWSWEKG